MRKVLTILLALTLCLGLAGVSQAEIKVGCALPMTGGIAFVGEAMMQGIEVALDEINGAGGVNGEKIVPQLEDTKSDPKVEKYEFFFYYLPIYYLRLREPTFAKEINLDSFMLH